MLRDEIIDLRGKMRLRWSRTFIIKNITLGGAIRITDLDGEEIFHPINMDRLRKYNI